MKTTRARGFVVFTLLVTGCQQFPADNTVSVTRFTQQGDGSVNSWIIEDNANIIVIDAQRTLSAGRDLANELEARNKPVRAILLTHPHPDHFGGLGSLLQKFPDTPILSSATTQRIMRNDENGFIALTKQVLKDDAPDKQPLPTAVFGEGEPLRWGDIVLVADERGIGEADSMTVFREPNQGYLFVGDVVDNGMTPFLLEGQTSQWLTQLEGMRADFEKRDLTVFPGHGPRTDTALFEEGERMLLWIRATVRDRLSDGLSESEIDDIVERYESLYPSRPPVAAIPRLMRENIRAVAAELEAQ